MVISNLTQRSLSSEVFSCAYKVLFQQVRYHNRPNLQRPLPVHYNRARMLAVCEPVLPRKPRNCVKRAMETKTVENPVADNPYAVFLAGKMRRDFASHPLIVVLHHNSFTQHELIDIRGNLYDMQYDMRIQDWINHNVARMALTGTKWSPLIHLMKSYTTLGFCSNDDIPSLQRALKKMPQFVLLAAVAHGRILHKEALEELGRLRDITNVRAQLSATLALQSVTLSQNLTANINALSHSLNTYVKGVEGDSSTSSSSSSSDSDSDSDSSSSSDSDNEKK